MRLANIFAITALLTSLVMVPAQAQPPTLSDLLGLEKPIDRLGVESRATIKEFVASVEMAAKESKEWRGVIDRMRADFASLPQEAGLESKQVVDFMLDRAKDNIGDMVAISKAINDKDYGQALKLFTEMQDRGPSKYPPVIGNFNPKIIPIKWTDSEKFQLDTDNSKGSGLINTFHGCS